MNPAPLPPPPFSTVYHHLPHRDEQQTASGELYGSATQYQEPSSTVAADYFVPSESGYGNTTWPHPPGQAKSQSARDYAREDAKHKAGEKIGRRLRLASPSVLASIYSEGAAAPAAAIYEQELHEQIHGRSYAVEAGHLPKLNASGVNTSPHREAELLTMYGLSPRYAKEGGAGGATTKLSSGYAPPASLYEKQTMKASAVYGVKTRPVPPSGRRSEALPPAPRRAWADSGEAFAPQSLDAPSMILERRAQVDKPRSST